MIVRPGIPASHFAWFVITLVVITAIATFLLFIAFAGDEPFLSFEPRVAIAHIGGGSTLFATWLFIIVAICYGVVTRRLVRAWLFLLLVAGIGLFYSRACVVDYISDIVLKVLPR